MEYSSSGRNSFARLKKPGVCAISPIFLVCQLPYKIIFFITTPFRYRIKINPGKEYNTNPPGIQIFFAEKIKKEV
jgi:hypothetical protein